MDRAYDHANQAKKTISIVAGNQGTDIATADDLSQAQHFKLLRQSRDRFVISILKPEVA